MNKLPETLITRLKSPGYQGARYEVLIAAVFARAGFDIEWIDDKKATGKHPEFIATHKRTGKRVGVETKSRKRPGTYDFRGSVSPETHLKGDVFGLYETAVKQAPQEGMPFLIFIDANVPATVAPGVPPHGDLPVDNFLWMKAIRDGLRVSWSDRDWHFTESLISGCSSFSGISPSVPNATERGPIFRDLCFPKWQSRLEAVKN